MSKLFLQRTFLFRCLSQTVILLFSFNPFSGVNMSEIFYSMLPSLKTESRNTQTTIA